MSLASFMFYVIFSCNYILSHGDLLKTICHICIMENLSNHAQHTNYGMKSKTRHSFALIIATKRCQTGRTGDIPIFRLEMLKNENGYCHKVNAEYQMVKKNSVAFASKSKSGWYTIIFCYQNFHITKLYHTLYTSSEFNMYKINIRKC